MPEARGSRHQPVGRIAKQHDIDYSCARNIQDKWKADDKMIRAINTLPGKNTWTEAIV